MKKRFVVILLVLLMVGCDQPVEKEMVEQPDEVLHERIKIETKEDIDRFIETMTLEEKAGQIIQAEYKGIQLDEISEYNIGSILSGGGSVPINNTPEGWVTEYNHIQTAAINSSTGIPIIYGIDAVHGHNNVSGAVIFPHNIGLGAGNNPDLMEQMGKVVATEILATGLDWNFGPALSVVQDIRWGRTYEGFSEEAQIVASLGNAYIKGVQSQGVVATAKHFIGDGYTTFGTGQGEILIDRGDVTVAYEDLLALYGPVYEAAIEADVKTIMASFNSINGTKVHGDKSILTDLLRVEMGFEGLLVSDWEAINELPGSLKEQVALAINAGVDLLMQPYNWKDVHQAIVSNVNEGTLSNERLNEAVKRVLLLKYEAGLFEKSVTKEAGVIASEETRAVARQAVAESMVLLKNENDVLPIQKSKKVYIMGPASDSVGVQCGGWTLSWQGDENQKIQGGTSVKEAFDQAGYELVTDVEESDVILLVIGEKPYAEMKGDTDDLSLEGPLALPGNMDAIDYAKAQGKPTVTLILSGRPLLINDHLEGWDGLVMGFLPGTEGMGIVDVLSGDVPFKGTLTYTWPKVNEDSSDSVNMIDYDLKDHQFKFGFGLTE